jgi:gliding motility-associated-like protein
MATTAGLANISSGTYTVVVTDLKNCTDTANFNVNPTVTITVNAGNDTTACGLSSLTLNGTVNAGTTVQWAQIPNPPGPVIANTATVTINPPTGTTQYVLIGTNNGCSMSDTISVTSNPLPVPDAGASLSTFTNFSVTLGGSPTNPSGGSVWWSPGVGLNDSTATNPVVTAPTITTTYTVYETNSFGCMGIDTVTVMVLPTFIIPNGFSPNGDGYNDLWIIDNIQLFPDCEVEVFNRWGEPLFYSKGYNSPWNGTYGGKPVPVGTYYYLIRLHDKEKKFPDHYTGPLTILR